jgi:AbrB family looped-hinge helix DNA binding protein
MVMKTTIDGSGRLVVPKPIRDRMQLSNGTELEVGERNGVIELRPVPADVETRDTPDGPVVAARGPMPPLTDEIIRETLDRIRR